MNRVPYAKQTNRSSFFICCKNSNVYMSISNSQDCLDLNIELATTCKQVVFCRSVALTDREKSQNFTLLVGFWFYDSGEC